MEVGRTRSWMAVYGPSAGDRKTISEFIRPHDLRLLVHDLPLSSSYAGFPGDEEADTILIHDDWVRKQIQARKGEFSTSHKIRIRVGTFNVNGQLPNHSIASWIRGGLSTEATGTRRNILESPDILIFGFQELDLSAGALLYSTSTLLEEQWSTSILKCLEGHPASYIKFASRQLVGMLILGFVRKAQRPYISEISTTSLGIGIMGLMGNKGAVGLRFRFRSSVITCVCSHLAANDGMAEKRNYDYLQISHRMQFPLNAATPAEAAEPLRPVSSTIFETHILIWLVYLNYRIELPLEEVFEMSIPPMTQKNISTLMEFDELLVAKRSRLCFDSFQEESIMFSPTYRYILNSNTLDPRRRPAWTDRIQHLVFPATSVRQLDKSMLCLHRSHGFRYMQQVIRTVIVTNDGDGPCAFRVIPSQEGGRYAPPWIAVEPIYGLILPQKSLSIDIKLIVDSPTARILNTVGEIDSCLIVHLEYGLDHFLGISGRFLPTCFARSFDSLATFPKPIREHGYLESMPQSRAASIPKEFMRVIDWLMSHRLTEDSGQLFQTAAPSELLNTITECLDTGKEFPLEQSVSWSATEVTLAFGEILLRFFQALPHPIVPPSIFPANFEASLENRAEFLELLPPVAVNVWVTLLAFLQFACLQSGESSSSNDEAERIAAVFAPVLIGDTDGPYDGSMPTPLQKREFIKRLLLA
ncbi:hypothetical protein FRC15_011489 [Serendipita sp. 397]|nr:hypothetical protein FRC15_011489 [Serendipita sp. 397]